jgi:hypothetical protein
MYNLTLLRDKVITFKRQVSNCNMKEKVWEPGERQSGRVCAKEYLNWTSQNEGENILAFLFSEEEAGIVDSIPPCRIIKDIISYVCLWPIHTMPRGRAQWAVKENELVFLNMSFAFTFCLWYFWCTENFLFLQLNHHEWRGSLYFPKMASPIYSSPHMPFLECDLTWPHWEVESMFSPLEPGWAFGRASTNRVWCCRQPRAEY